MSRYPSAMEAYFGATPEQIFDLAEVAQFMKQKGCTYLAELTHEVGGSLTNLLGLASTCQYECL